MKTTTLILAVLALIMVGVIAPRAEEMDLAKALVGKWEGEFQRRGKGQGTPSTQNVRTLEIESVRKQDGKWVVEKVQYGLPGKMRPENVKLNMTGSDVRLELGVPGVGGRLSVKLIGEDTLKGTIDTDSGSFDIELKKAR
jgi:hypothetical protein